MKLYSFTPAANALRVEMFLREKNINIETIQMARIFDGFILFL